MGRVQRKFDGDQMDVYLPLSLEDQVESHLLMFSHMNLLSPAIGDPIFVPTQDMFIGLYVLMIWNHKGICTNRLQKFARLNSYTNKYNYLKMKVTYCCNSYDALGAYQQK